MTKSFDAIKIVDFTTTIAGPHCTRLFADLGAEVIKIETPEGDMMRTRPPMRGGASAMFGQLNCGKKSVVLDLKSEIGRDALYRIIADADVVVENYRPGVTKRLGIDYASLAATRPDLIYCSVSGYGQTGPSAKLAAYAPVIHAASGYDLAHMSYQPGRERPDYCGIYIADVLAGTYAFGAIASAIVQRKDTGEGQHIDVSMLESMLSLTLLEMQEAQFEMPPRPSRPLFGPVETLDGYINIAVASERTFDALAKAAGRLDWFEDPRFKEYNDRRANWGALMDEFEAWSRTVTNEQCLATLAEHGVPAAAYRTVREAMADPQLAHREAFVTVEDAGGAFQALNPPFRMSRTVAAAGARVPGLGEHTQEILARSGMSEQDIRAAMG
ncbi:MAG: CoA transferase [Alphaproteobacteria bacterium]|nr:CoA transferase [Alphaproteobacteria bacterium]